MAQQSLETREGNMSVVQVPQDEPRSGPTASFLQAQQFVNEIGLASMARELGGFENLFLRACQKNELNIARVILSNNAAELKTDGTLDELLRDAMLSQDQWSTTVNLELIDLLLKYGADPLIEAWDGRNPIAALAAGVPIRRYLTDPRVIEHLLQHGFPITLDMMQHDLDGFEYRVAKRRESSETVTEQATCSSSKPISSISSELIGRQNDVVHGSPHSSDDDRPDETTYTYVSTDHLKSPVYCAAHFGNVECAKLLWEWTDRETSLLRGQGGVQARKEILERAILCAIAGRRVNVLEVLPRSACIDANDGRCITGDAHLLFFAIAYSGRHDDDVPVFLLNNYNFDLWQHDGAPGANALIRAVEKDLFGTAKLMLQKDPGLISSLDSDGLSLYDYTNKTLIRAIGNSENDTAQLIFEQYGVQRSVDALSRALQKDLFGIAQSILKKYPDLISSLDTDGLSPYDHAANALCRAAKKGEDDIAQLILEQYGQELINYQCSDGSTPAHSAAESWHTAVHKLFLSQRNFPVDLVDGRGSELVDRMVERAWGDSVYGLIPLLENGLNRVDSHGCTLLHSLIDCTWHNGLDDKLIPEYQSWYEQGTHRSKLERYEGRTIFERRGEWAALEELNRRDYAEMASRPNYVDSEYLSYQTGRTVNLEFRRALEAGFRAATREKSSPTCICGISSIFLAISTENVELVEALLEFYPDLVRESFWDGSSPLDLADCILNSQIRKGMIRCLAKHGLIRDIPAAF